MPDPVRQPLMMKVVLLFMDHVHWVVPAVLAFIGAMASLISIPLAVVLVIVCYGLIERFGHNSQGRTRSRLRNPGSASCELSPPRRETATY